MANYHAKYPDSPKIGDYSDPAAWRRDYRNWYYHNVIKPKQQPKEPKPERPKRTDRKTGQYPPMSEGSRQGRENYKTLQKVQANTDAREAEIAERIEYIELPEDMSAEEYEKVLFS